MSADKVTVVGGGFVNTGKINANYISLKANTSSGGRQVTLGGEIVATEQFAYYGSGHNQYNTPLTAKLTTKHLLIDSHGAPEGQVGLSVVSSETLKNVDKISIVGAVSKTGLSIGSDATGEESVDVSAPIYLNGKDGDARVEIFKGRTLTADRIISTETGKAKVQANGGSFLNVSTIEVAKNADLSLVTNGSASDASEFHLDTIFVNDGHCCPNWICA